MHITLTTKVWALGLAAAMSLAQKSRELQCRSQAIMPMLSGQARWCTKIVES
jgi:hypothetical protein